MFFLIVYIADILLGLKVTETGNAGAYLSGLIVLIGTPLTSRAEETYAFFDFSIERY